MENYNAYIPQIEALISSGSRDSIKLALEIAVLGFTIIVIVLVKMESQSPLIILAL